MLNALPTSAGPDLETCIQTGPPNLSGPTSDP